MESFQPKSFVFVLMPFSPDFDDVYQFGIKKACENCGVDCERVDEQDFEGSIVERIYNQISKADIIIADMTGKNPNVLYEAGYAHALKKSVILITQSVGDIPFDLSHYVHVIYDKNNDKKFSFLIPKLERKINFVLNSKHKSTIKKNTHLQVLSNGSKSIDTLLNVQIQKRNGSSTFNLEFYNQYSEPISFQFGIITPSVIADITNSTSKISSQKSFTMKYYERLHFFEDEITLYPEVRKFIDFNILFGRAVKRDDINCTLRLFFKSGYSDYKLNLIFKK